MPGPSFLGVLYASRVDRHKIWRITKNNLQIVQDDAPDGYRAVVDVYLLGQTRPVRLDVVETTRDPEFPWVLLVPEQDPSLPVPMGRILVPEQHIERIEITLVAAPEDELELSQRSGIGFSYEAGALDDPGDE
jgi:hypothetical protein